MPVRGTTYIFVFALMASGCGPGSASPDAGDAPDFAGTDSDADTIMDADEEAGEGVDTDDDEVPDYLDEDSDGDGIPDWLEAGDADTSTPPVDSDSDGTPDFRDLDSDGNGILDSDDGTGDPDGDGAPNHADPDDDGDGIDDVDEIGGVPDDPVDTDGDDLPDHLDVDSDNDTISDLDEGNVDTDDDLVPDRLDHDSDGDGIPDSTEAGDGDVETPPRDTDGDLVPDFRDHDSDGDGISDAWEFDHGLDPYDKDTDGDGFDDLIEVGAGTDPRDAGDSPVTRVHIIFIMFFDEDPDPSSEIVVLSTTPVIADVFFLVDGTGTLGEEAGVLGADLVSRVAPAIRAWIPDTWFGVGTFTDCHPTSCDSPMRVLVQMDGDEALSAAGLMEIHDADWCGTNPPYTQALVLAATGDTGPFSAWTGLGPAPGGCASTRIGWPCFRPNARPVVVQVGDKSFASAIRHCAPSMDRADTIDALAAIGAVYVGLSSGASRDDMAAVALGTGSVDDSGLPLVRDVPPDGASIGEALLDAFESMIGDRTVDLAAVVRDDPSDDVDATVFVDSVAPYPEGGVADPVDPAIVCASGLGVQDRTGDTVPDAFSGVPMGTRVCFEVNVRRNTTVPADDHPQTFGAFLDLLDDSGSVLQTRQMVFLVPPYEY